MAQQFTAIYQKHGTWYVGWVEEIPGVNTQGRTLSEVKSNLKEALSLILEINRAMAYKDVFGKVIRERVSVAHT